jgi:hypothetical protein
VGRGGGLTAHHWTVGKGGGHGGVGDRELRHWTMGRGGGLMAWHWTMLIELESNKIRLN